MKWFGEPWPNDVERAPICEDDLGKVRTPTGKPCFWCEEPVLTGDRGIMMVVSENYQGAREAPWHIECFVRSTVGGPAHLEGTCTCQGGQNEPDLGLSRRGAAMLSWEWVNEHA